MKNSMISLEHVSLEALIPEHILPYVNAVSTVHSVVENNFLIHYHNWHAILIGYALGATLDSYKNVRHHPQPNLDHGLEHAIKQLTTQPHLERITVLAPHKPLCVPPHAQCHSDAYYFLALPLVQEQARNALSMCRRALPHIRLEKSTEQHSAWTSAHQELMLSYLQRADITKETGSIFQRLDAYGRSTAQMQIFSAYDTHSGQLMGMCLGDFTSLHTAFYMFAFRHTKAVPGVSEALLAALVQEAQELGYMWCNLGLGINTGIGFFKEKWGAKPLLPLVECSWSLQPEQEQDNSPAKAPWWQKILGKKA